MTIRMYPHAVINVRVVDENAEPLPNVQVQALKYSYLRGQRQLIPVAAGATNDLGEQRMHGLVPGQYFISAVYRPSGMYKETVGTSDPAKEQYAPVYFPGTHDPSGAAAIEAVGGQIQTLHLSMRRTRTIRVRGRVSFQVAARISPSTMVVLLPRGSDLGLASSRPVARVRDILGNFELVGVTPGSYTLTAEWDDSGRRYVGRELLEAGSSDIDGVAVTLHAAPDVKGRVSSQDAADGALGGIRVVLHPRETSGSAIASALEVSGNFSLKNVAPGSYAIMLAGLPRDHYLKSVRTADQELLDSGFRLGPGETPPQLNILVSAAGAQIQGLVLNESQQPAGGSTVVLVPNARTRTDLFKLVNADQSGRFAFDGIAPGGYRLFAWDEIETGAAEDPEFLKQFENAGQPLQFKERDRQSVQLAVIPAAARR